MVGYSYDVRVTIVPDAMSGQILIIIAHEAHSQPRLMTTFLPVACLAPSSTIKASQQG